MNIITKHPFLFILLLNFIVYSSLLSGQPSVNPDAQIILANLSIYNNLSEYLYSLFTFQAIDFQPLRDFTFWIDILFFNEFNFNTFTVQNLIWWVGCCCLVFRIQQKNFPDKENIILLLVLAFSVYPLFSFIIPWGMARKHIIAFFFFLSAINSVVSLKKANSFEILKISMFYFLSLLAQPIAILFPFWIAFYFFFIKKFSKKDIFFILLPNILIQIVFILLNYFYYTSSNIFLYFYGTKFYHGRELGDSLLALGHYHFQIIFPYLLSFTYGLGDFSSIVGVGILVILGLIIYKNGKNYFEILSIVLPGYLVFSIILSTPHQLYDTYLLIPTFSYLSLLIYFFHHILSRKKFILIGLLILTWSVQSYFESRKWLNYVALAESSFERRPNCKNAINYARISYESEKSPNSNAKKFLTFNQCLQNLALTEFDKVGHVNFLGNILYYEEFFTVEERLHKLDQLANNHFNPQLVKAALLINTKKFTEADNEIKKIIKKLQKNKSRRFQFHAITAKVIYPYCMQKNWAECLKITSKFNSKPKKPYL